MTEANGFILFDYDGVLVDTLPRYIHVATKIAQRFGNGSQITEDTVRSNWGGGWQNFYGRVLGVPEEKMIEATAFYRELQREDGPPPLFEGIEAAVKRLAESYKLFIITASSVKNVRNVLGFHKLESFFEDIFSQELLPNVRKGDPKFFLIPMQKWGVIPDRTVSIGDTIDEIVMGEKALVKTIACAWGWQSTELLEQTHPDALINSPDQLVETVCKLLPKSES